VRLRKASDLVTLRKGVFQAEPMSESTNSQARQVSDSVVACYSGHTYAQEPRALKWEGCRYLVAEVEARWRTPDGPAFRVRTAPGQRFDLQYYELRDRWRIIPIPGCQSSDPHVEDKEVQP
jgi:hypothetical protein